MSARAITASGARSLSSAARYAAINADPSMIDFMDNEISEAARQAKTEIAVVVAHGMMLDAVFFDLRLRGFECHVDSDGLAVVRW